MNRSGKMGVTVVALLVIAGGAIALLSRGPKVSVPEQGPAIVEEAVPAAPEERAAFDRRKAASACRVAIMQSANVPGSVEFADELDATPVAEQGAGTYDFQIAIKARNDAGDLLARHILCRAEQQEAGWAITELKEAATL